MFKFIIGFFAGLVFAVLTTILAAFGIWIGLDTSNRDAAMKKSDRPSYAPRS